MFPFQLWNPYAFEWLPTMLFLIIMDFYVSIMIMFFFPVMCGIKKHLNGYQPLLFLD